LHEALRRAPSTGSAGGVVEGFYSRDWPEKEARICGIRRVQNIVEIPLDGRGICVGTIVELDAFMQVKDVGASVILDAL